MITSRHNQRIKDAVRLRERRQRMREQRFLIEGIREVDRALAGNVPLLEAFISPEHLVGREAHRLIQRLHDARVPSYEVSAEVFRKLSYGERGEGIVAVGRILARVLDDIRLPPRPIVAVLEGIEKPGNLGAIARTADGAGVSLLVATGEGTDIWNPNAIRASLGTLFTLPVVQADADAVLSWAIRTHLPICAATPEAERLYHEADLADGAVLVLGSEAEGLSDTWRTAGITPIRLPMCGMADSLNVSATAAVLFYESLRQRS